ncbi:MAG: hypothetical protein IT293_01980 [Deltaproteobacteria bacterium]|nr:hypothetical protein [Deltaproteobacteria bacterium]
MDQLFFHPKVVHLPMALAVLMPLVSAGLLATWWAGLLPRRAWLVAVALQLVLVGSGVVALRSGEHEEERVERVVAEKLIKAHEEAAEAFVWSAGAILLLQLAAAALRREESARAAAAAAVAGTLLILFLGYRTGEAGGRLVYQHGAAAAYTSGSSGGADGSAASAAHDDD